MNLLFALFLPCALAKNSPSPLMGSCKKSQLCCEGKNGDCVVQKADINSIIMDPEDEPCYCDHNCLNMGDCCPDFKDYCGGERPPPPKKKAKYNSRDMPIYAIRYFPRSLQSTKNRVFLDDTNT